MNNDNNEYQEISKSQKVIPLLLFFAIFGIIICIFCAFFSGLKILYILMIFLFGFIIGIFYKELILFLIPNKTLINIGYLKLFEPHYDKFVNKYLNLLNDDEINKIIKIGEDIFKNPLIKNLIEKENNFDIQEIKEIENKIKDIKEIFKKIIPVVQLLGIDIKKGFGEPVTEIISRFILKDNKKEQLMTSIYIMERLLYGLSCTNQSKPSIKEVKNELNTLKELINS